VIPTADRRNARLLWQTWNECPKHLRVLIDVRLAGKPTTFSHRDTSTGNSFATESFAGLRRFRHPGSLSSHGPNVRCVAAVRNLAWTKSKVLKSRKSTADPAIARSFLKSLDIREFERTADDTGVDKNRSTEYRCLRKGWSCWGDSASPGPRDSCPSAERSRALTPFREGRSRDFCWLQSGRFPDRSVRPIVILHDIKESSVPPCAVQDFPNKFDLTDLRFSIAGRRGVASS